MLSVMCRAVNIIFGDNFSRRVRKGVRDPRLVPFLTFGRTDNLQCRDPEICQESMHVRFDHRVAQQICVGSTNLGPRRPGDRATPQLPIRTSPPVVLRLFFYFLIIWGLGDLSIVWAL